MSQELYTSLYFGVRHHLKISTWGGIQCKYGKRKTSSSWYSNILLLSITYM